MLKVSIYRKLIHTTIIVSILSINAVAGLHLQKDDRYEPPLPSNPFEEAGTDIPASDFTTIDKRFLLCGIDAWPMARRHIFLQPYTQFIFSRSMAIGAGSCEPAPPSQLTLRAWEHIWARSLIGPPFTSDLSYGVVATSVAPPSFFSDWFLSSCIYGIGDRTSSLSPFFPPQHAPGFGMVQVYLHNQPEIPYFMEERVSQQEYAGQDCACFSMHQSGSFFEMAGTLPCAPPPSPNYQRSVPNGTQAQGIRWCNCMVCTIYVVDPGPLWSNAACEHYPPTEGNFGKHGRWSARRLCPSFTLSVTGTEPQMVVAHHLSKLCFHLDCGVMDMLTDDETPSHNVRIHAACASKGKLIHLPSLHCLDLDAYPNGENPRGWMQIHASAFLNGTAFLISNGAGETSSQSVRFYPVLQQFIVQSIFENSYHTYYRPHKRKACSLLRKPYPGFAVSAIALAVTFRQPAHPRSGLALFPIPGPDNNLAHTRKHVSDPSPVAGGEAPLIWSTALISFGPSLAWNASHSLLRKATTLTEAHSFHVLGFLLGSPRPHPEEAGFTYLASILPHTASIGFQDFGGSLSMVSSCWIGVSNQPRLLADHPDQLESVEVTYFDPVSILLFGSAHFGGLTLFRIEELRVSLHGLTPDRAMLSSYLIRQPTQIFAARRIIAPSGMTTKLGCARISPPVQEAEHGGRPLLRALRS